jgi:peptide/nickel transport system permease protein
LCLLPYIGVGFANAALGAIFALVGLEVIGLGPGNIIDLGLMINWAISWGVMSLGAWPMFVAPIVVLSLLFIATNLINIGLEETYNPRLRGTAGA